MRAEYGAMIPISAFENATQRVFSGNTNQTAGSIKGDVKKKHFT